MPKMKKYFLILLLACSLTVQTSAQDAAAMQRMQELNKEMQSISQQIRNAFDNKNYALVAELNYKGISMVDSNHDFLLAVTGSDRQVESLKGYFYYDLACSYSRRGMNEGALYHLGRAVACDYNDWKHILEDHDLDNIRNDARMDSLIDIIRNRADYVNILQQAAPYTTNERRDTLPVFTYQSASDPNLQRVKAYFNLDKVAGNGDEISRIKNVMGHIHNLIRHDGSNGNPEHLNAIDLVEACKDGSRGLNCRGMAIVLNECFLAMGIPSRYVTCMPREFINDCHVINAVWSSQLGKWLWIDPEFNAWVTDEQGNMLSIQEVRENLRNGTPVVLNKEANWNNQNKETTEEYLYNYMAKNLYYLIVSANQEYGLEDHAVPNATHMVSLVPTGFSSSHTQGLVVSDDTWFWQAPQ